VTHEDAESKRIYAAGLVIRDLPALPSSWRSEGDLGAWLANANVVGIADVDTRQLTRILREKGAQNGCILAAASIGTMETEQALAAAREAPSMAGQDLAKVVSIDTPYDWRSSTWALGEGYRSGPRRSTRSSRTTSASSTTSCACSRRAAATSTSCRRGPRRARCWR
jgi:carbamoyl-phosphate synthase small subunit